MTSTLPEDVAAVEIVARAMAIHDDYDGCFLRVDEWEATEEWEREAHPENRPHDDYEECERWRERAHAGLAALAARPTPPEDVAAIPDPSSEEYADFEAWEIVLGDHRPVTSMHDGSIAGCVCLDRVFLRGKEDWASHLASVVTGRLTSPSNGSAGSVSLLDAIEGALEVATHPEDVAEGERCTLPPPGWRCSRTPGHDGPCAARPNEETR